MENGSFQELNLSHLDFANEVDEDFQQAPISKINRTQHSVMEFKSVPKDLAKSGSIQALFAQNEDLMARLKVTIQRMTLTEDENKNLNEELQDLKKSFSATSDQMLVWKEKEKLWKERHQHLEAEVQAFNSRFPDYKNMEARIERYQRYQDRVKNQIKPYIHQLKDYAQSLHEQLLGLNRELEAKEAQVSDLNHQLMSNKEQLEQQIQFYEINQNDLVNSFEKQRADLIDEIDALSEVNQALELKAQRLDRSLERQDELENLVVALRRSKEDFQNQVQAELENLRENSSRQNLAIQEKDLLIEDLRRDYEAAKIKMQQTEGKRIELEEQLTSLRYMWTTKSEENENLKISMQSLEKINLDLSNKLNELRKKSEVKS